MEMAEFNKKAHMKNESPLRISCYLLMNALRQKGLNQFHRRSIFPIGPGSFTGIRIGVSSARGIAEMLNIPCISISSLEGMHGLC